MAKKITKMRIYYYCQHVLGVGHFFRSLEICRALREHDVTMITGGTLVDVEFPSTVSNLQLPGLMMDPDFSGFYSSDPGRSVEAIKAERIEHLKRFVKNAPPDVLMIELYPFGRKAFRFELDPVLEHIRSRAKAGSKESCLVVCSLRDILVEKKDPDKYEKRVVAILNRYFDLLLIHADPQIIRLDKTFSRLGKIDIPALYTGFIAPAPAPGSRRRIRRRLNLCDDTALIVASAGGGSVGEPLLRSVLQAFERLNPLERYRLQLFCGPFMADGVYRELQKLRSRRIGIERFSSDFPAWLAAADLSVSMAGYNTCMNILAAGTPALVWPFGQNREQGIRAERLREMGLLHIAADKDLSPSRMAVLMQQALEDNRSRDNKIQLNGAAKTASAVENYVRQLKKRGAIVGQ